MAKKINDFFFDDDPPFDTTAQPEEEQAQPQDISLEKEPPMVQAPVNDAPAPTDNELPEMTEKGKRAIGLTPGTPSNVSPEQAAIPKEDSIYPSIDKIREDVKAGYNPLFALVNANKPVIDEAKQERLKRIAAVNSIGKGLGTVLQGFYGKKGATITPDKSTLLPEAYKEYMDNISDYDRKTDLWNKDVLALSLKQQGDISAKAEKVDDQKRADKLADEAYKKQREIAELQLSQQKAQFDAEMEFKKAVEAAKTPEQLKIIQAEHKNRMAEISASFDNQFALEKQAIEAGKYQRSSSSGSIVDRPANAASDPLAFRNSSGQQIFLKADQFDIIEDVLQRALREGLPEYYANKASYDKVIADGKMSESDARSILSAFADRYYNFVPDENNHSVAVPKGSTSSTFSTGGRY